MPTTTSGVILGSLNFSKWIMPMIKANVRPTGQIRQKTGKEKIAEEANATPNTKNGPFF